MAGIGRGSLGRHREPVRMFEYCQTKPNAVDVNGTFKHFVLLDDMNVEVTIDKKITLHTGTHSR